MPSHNCDGTAAVVFLASGSDVMAHERMKLGTAAVILPWNDPLRVAEKMIMLDILSGGRAIFGMGGRLPAGYRGSPAYCGPHAGY